MRECLGKLLVMVYYLLFAVVSLIGYDKEGGEGRGSREERGPGNST